MADEREKQRPEGPEERRARRLREEMGINDEGVEVVLRLCEELTELQDQLRQMEIELNHHRQRSARYIAGYRFYYEASWRDWDDEESE